jgi:UDP:flavonoid glycosyltransferase YjiC (YdhE family)
MRVLLPPSGGRGDVEPLAGLAVRLRELGAEVRVCDIARVAIEAIRARATAVAATIRTDGATVAATLLLDAISRERPPVSA